MTVTSGMTKPKAERAPQGFSTLSYPMVPGKTLKTLTHKGRGGGRSQCLLSGYRDRMSKVSRLTELCHFISQLCGYHNPVLGLLLSPQVKRGIPRLPFSRRTREGGRGGISYCRRQGVPVEWTTLSQRTSFLIIPRNPEIWLFALVLDC